MHIRTIKMIILKDEFEFQKDGIWNAYLVANKDLEESSYVESLEHIDQKA